MKAFAYGLAFAGLVLAARSATADSSLDRVRACMPQQNDAARLACYDKELGRTAAAPAPAPTAGVPAAAAVTPSAAVPATPVAPVVARTAVVPVTPAPPRTADVPATAGTAAAPATAATKAADFGMTPELLHKQQERTGIKPPPPPPETLSAKVAKVGTYGNGLLVVTLDNGQVWQQQESGESLLAVGDPVKISRGMFGSLWMDDASHRRMRVKRVQ